ncbi:hypothetical protein FOZ62_005577, partial [Perkinsus olseni]
MDRLQQRRQSWGIRMVKKTLGAILRSAPPRPCKEVETELRNLKMGLHELHQIYGAFYHLKQNSSRRLVLTAKEIPADSVINLVRDRREYASAILRSLVELGGCFDTVKWDEFLYIFLRFCSLSKIELCQLMFLIIVKEVKSWTVHYLTASQLDEFYSRFHHCPVQSFDTHDIHFGRLALSRYYTNDFVELCFRFGKMVNPLLHLQRCIQRSVPSLAFWENYDRTEVFNRKLTLEFFLIRKTHFFLQGEPSFRESCDMLLPAVMGADLLQRNQAPVATTDEAAPKQEIPSNDVPASAAGVGSPVRGFSEMLPASPVKTAYAPLHQRGPALQPPVPTTSNARGSLTEFETSLRLLPKVPGAAGKQWPSVARVVHAAKIATALKGSFATKKKSSVEEESDDGVPFDDRNISIEHVPKWMQGFVNPPVKKSMAERSQEAEFIRKCRERKSETKGVVRHSLGVTPWRGRVFDSIDPELMNEKLNPALSGGGGFGPMCHRLDKETSGPVLVAKTLDSWKFIRRQFQKEQVQKQYVCLVEGICARDGGVIDSPIRVRRTEKHTSAEIGSGPASSSAHSEYRVLERYEEGCTLISVKISTGVTHQIRVHMAQGLNHPIVGDRKYTPSGRQLELPSVARIPDRVFLHCYELGFRADESSDRLTTIRCSLPTELRNLLWSLTPTSSCPLPADSRALLAGLTGLPTGAAAMQRWHIPYSNLLSQLNTALVSGRVHRIKECNSDPAVEEDMRQNLQ